jgi:hypothetical protein
MRTATIGTILILFFLSGCATTDKSPGTQTVYHPISPQCVEVSDENAALSIKFDTFLQNEAGFFGMETNTITANAGGAGTQANASSNTARIDNDFMMYRTYPLSIVIAKTEDGDSKYYAVYAPSEAVDKNATVVFTGAIPVYIGIGVRIQADVSNFSASLNVGSLPAISAAVSAGSTKGTISVVAMGITGNSIGLMIQQPVDLNDTTIQSALQSVGAIKASLATAEKADPSQFNLHPQVIGFDSAVSDPAELQAIQEHIVSTTFTLQTKQNGNEYDVTGITSTQSTTSENPEVALEAVLRRVAPYMSETQMNNALLRIEHSTTTQP